MDTKKFLNTIGVKPEMLLCSSGWIRWWQCATPKAVRWCDGSDEEWQELCQLMMDQGSMIRLNPENVQIVISFGQTRGMSLVERVEPSFVVTVKMTLAQPIIGKSLGR